MEISRQVFKINLNILIFSASLCTQKGLLEFSDVSVTV